MLGGKTRRRKLIPHRGIFAAAGMGPGECEMMISIRMEAGTGAGSCWGCPLER